MHIIPGFYAKIYLLNSINELVKLGYFNYIVNNLSHLNLVKKIEKLNLIAGEYLYTFNSFAIKFLYENGISYFISPLENNKKNLYSSVIDKNSHFITILTFPLLFKIRASLSKKYKFNYFYDIRENGFYLINKEKLSFVIPEQPFSIIDKVNELKRDGFNKFIIDLSYSRFNKGDYKKIFSLIQKSLNLPTSTRFNWKDGFKKE